MNIQLITDIISLIFILVGAVLSFAGSVGLVRFGDTMSRIHAVAKPQTAGLVLTIVGAIIRVAGSPHLSAGERGDMGVLVLLIVFSFLTSPVTAQRIGRVARREGLYAEKDRMSRNDAPADRSLNKRR
ncbi:monovalent cation/H(+) antiporter subunit G [Corynebacterium lowii]|uniref:Na(+)/H(+) antiporter subunit G n=1 Tax=Corynebacterium lowii TaxID=1544413 RepID=A0A0Q1AHL4_9CORY|nr:monovalent cation/H(+) antiporter subunit G [Corynebacterium lowii]KQB86164.1 Na(+)/H(+) antiporter subunit G [Corynebacterium lowii]MDP9852639.1 multicomponent Na+:H+ antiporter subunit G [Corynebacterium lowii]